MQYRQVKVIVFSPTGTTRRIAAEVAAGLGYPEPRVLDYTRPAVRAAEPADGGGDLVILAAPVYSGRLPAVAADAFRQLAGNGAPAVLLVVYGNRAYEDALLELQDIAVNAGFVPVAGAAFIGEHSFSSSDIPIAPGRPDADDCRQAYAFGQSVRAKLAGADTAADLPPLELPGNFPYRERSGRSPLAPETDTALCRKCGICTAVCPTGAVADGDNVSTAAGCLLCHACVRQCPAGARSFTHPRVKESAQWLNKDYAAPKTPETFL